MQKVNKTIIRIPKQQVLPTSSRQFLFYLQQSLENLEIDLLNELEPKEEESAKEVPPLYGQSHFLSTLRQRINHFMISIFS